MWNLLGFIKNFRHFPINIRHGSIEYCKDRCFAEEKLIAAQAGVTARYAVGMTAVVLLPHLTDWILLEKVNEKK